MDNKIVYLLLAASVAGNAYQATIPGATTPVMAAINEVSAYVFKGRANAALKTKIEAGLGLDALTHANSQLQKSGQDALSAAGEACPIKSFRVECVPGSQTEDGKRAWDWRYETVRMNTTKVYGEPQ